MNDETTDQDPAEDTEAHRWKGHVTPADGSEDTDGHRFKGHVTPADGSEDAAGHGFRRPAPATIEDAGADDDTEGHRKNFR